MSRRHHRTRLIATLTAVGASLGLAVGVALAFNPTLSNFEIEGDLTSGIFNGGGSAPTVTGVDWADGGPGFGALLNDGTDNPAEPGSASLITDPVSGNGDTSTFQASKENDNSLVTDPPPPGGKLKSQTPWSIVTGQSQPKDDLTNSYFYGLISGNQADVVVGAERTSVNGESHLDFEFNQLDWVTCPTDADSLCPQRQEGDVLVAANIDSDGVTTFYNVYVWDLPGGIDAGAGLRAGVTPASTTNCDGYAIAGNKPAKFAGCPWEEVVFEQNEIIGVLNTAPIAAGPWGSKDSSNANRTTIPTAGFFEAFLDFDALGFPPSCPGFAKASVKTRASGEGITSSMSDLSGPVDIDLNTCANIVVKKVMVGGTDTFTYTGTPSGSIAVNNGTIMATVAPGNYASVEAAPPTGWALTSISCNDSDSSGTLGTRTANFVVANNETVICTFTNTLQPTLTINKVCVPTTDPGLFNLREDGVTKTANAACGTGTGAFQTTIGAHTVSETAGTNTSLANYSSVISGDCNAAGSVTLAAGDNKTCTITNTRIPTLTINKVCVPTTDPGLFNLREDGVTKTANAACGTGTGAFQTTIGAHTVSETAGTNTSLANYSSVISGDCNAAGSVTLAAGDNKTCTITNTRIPTLTINKVCVPTTDPGLFNLREDGVTKTANAACGTGTGAFQTTIGAHTVSETAGTNTSLANYSSVISGDCNAAGSVTLAAGDNKTCTITNTRIPTLTINKVCVPTTDPGLFNLREDGVTKTANAACGTGTGAFQTTIGAHTVSETAGTNTSLANYSSVISGDCNAAGSVTLAAGDNKTCTITNTRIPTLTINKVCVPTTDPGLFNLREDGVTKTANAACGTGTGAFQTTIGAHTVSETAGTNTSLANYSSVISGDCAADGSVTLAAGDNKTCTITNTRLFKIIVLVCAQSTNTLHSSTVTVDGVDKTSLATGGGGALTDAALCALGGAAYPDKGTGNHPANVNIPS